MGLLVHAKIVSVGVSPKRVMLKPIGSACSVWSELMTHSRFWYLLNRIWGKKCYFLFWFSNPVVYFFSWFCFQLPILAVPILDQISKSVIRNAVLPSDEGFVCFEGNVLNQLGKQGRFSWMETERKKYLSYKNNFHSEVIYVSRPSMVAGVGRATNIAAFLR